MQKLSMPCALSLMTLIKARACIPQQRLNAERMWKLKFSSRQRAQPFRSHSLTFPPALIICCPLFPFCTSHPRGTLNSLPVIVNGHTFDFCCSILKKRYTPLKMSAASLQDVWQGYCVFIGRSHLSYVWRSGKTWRMLQWLKSDKQP